MAGQARERDAGRRRLTRRLAALAVTAAAAAGLLAPASAGALALQSVGPFDSPIYVTSPPGDPRLFVVERGGTIKVVKGGATLPADFLDISARTTTDGERGLLSMAFHPDFASNGLFYVDYTGDGADSGGTVGDIHVDEYRVGPNPDVADPASRRDVFVVNRPSAGASNHNGGQLQFGPDRHLYVSVGDGADASTAQDPADRNGKLLRVDPTSGAPPEIWSLGLRNPWRFSFDSLDGSLLIADVGAGSREEVDYARQPAAGQGLNFGWPTCEGLQGPASCSSFTPPTFDYPHAGCPGGFYAITGGYVYRGSDIPELAGRYLYTDICFKEIRSLVPGLPSATGDRSEGLTTAGTPISFGQDSRCELYVAAGDEVLKIVRAPGAQPTGGGCAATAARPALTVTLRAKKRRVARGKRAVLRATVAPCVAAGERVVLRRGKRKARSSALSGACQARFRVKIRRRSQFKAEVPAGPGHLGGISKRVRIKLKG